MAGSAALQFAGQILAELTVVAVHEIGTIWDVKTDLKKLEFAVSSIQAILLDAAEQKKTNKQVSDWLEKLHDVLEDATNLLDDFMTEKLQRRVVIKGSKQKAVKNFFSSSNSLVLRVEMSYRLQSILKGLKDIDPGRKRFQLGEYVPNRSVRNQETHSYIRFSEVIGRDGDKDRIIHLLLSTPSSTGSSMTIAEDIPVLPVVGVGGLGKTTLAKLIFNNNAISSHFELKLWTCVSEEFDLKKLTEKIMKDATGGVDHSQLDLNQLQHRLRTTLESKKFLLVLDDVWNEDLGSWIELKELLRCGAQGSRVLVTTRKRTTAQIMGTFPLYELKGLSDDECMSIFVRCAFKEGEDGQYKDLLEVGKAIVKKCNGLPLAAKSLGSLLFTKREEREWVRILETALWENSQKENDMLPILRLRYDDIPQHLKQCFAYCAVFPKDAKISRFVIVALWMANGLLNSHDNSLVLEDIGEQYLKELISRSFFQDVTYLYDGSVNTFQMHNLVHDLALSVAGTEFPDFLLKLGKLRTLRFEFASTLFSNKFLDTLIKTFRCLRVLHIAGSEIEELPNSIGMLKHLRFLDLSHNVNLKQLSKNLCTLINLQTLHLQECIMLQILPREFGNLWSLRLLSLSGQMKCFPVKGVAKGLSSLQELWLSQCVHLDSFLDGTQCLVTLRTLRIYTCPELISLTAQTMRGLTSLEHLIIADCEKFSFSDEGSEMMELPRGLLSLVLIRLPELKELPSGIQGDSPPIYCINIKNCNSFEILPEWLQKCTSLSKLRLADCAKNLIEDCQPETGKYFPFISHILQIDIF